MKVLRWDIWRILRKWLRVMVAVINNNDVLEQCKKYRWHRAVLPKIVKDREMRLGPKKGKISKRSRLSWKMSMPCKISRTTANSNLIMKILPRLIRLMSLIVVASLKSLSWAISYWALKNRKHAALSLRILMLL